MRVGQQKCENNPMQSRSPGSEHERADSPSGQRRLFRLICGELTHRLAVSLEEAP